MTNNEIQVDNLVTKYLEFIPHDWHVTNLSSIAIDEKNAIVDGPFGSQLKVAELVDEGIPFIEMFLLKEDLSDNNIHKKIRRFVSVEKFNEIKRSMVKGGDVVISKTGTLGLVGLLPKSFNMGIISSRLAKITPNLNLIEPQFLSYWLIFLRDIGFWEMIGEGSTMKVLNLTKISNAPIFLSPPPEQRAIAQMLTTVRQAIDATEQVIDAARELKRSMMKHLFTYGPVPVQEADQVKLKETEIGAIPECWEMTTINEVAGVKGGKRLPKGHLFSQEPTHFPYIRVTDFSNYSVNTSNLKYINEIDWQQIKNYTISKDDVYISIAGTIGLVGAVPIELDGANLTENAAKIIILDKAKLDNSYLVNYLASQRGHFQIRIRTAKTSQPKLALSRIKQIPLPLPSLGNQQTISNYLSSIDEKLSTEIEKLNALDTLFTSLLHHLMTGKVRVPYEQ